MIKIQIENENNQIKNIIISGHANYNEYGKDIVCAGVSSITTTTINAILSFAETILVTDNQNKLIINVLENDYITTTLLNNMLNLLTDLESQYPKNISITKGK